MKLTPNQKELLACIKDKEIRKEVKKEFKRKTKFYRTNWKLLDEPIASPKNDEFKIDNSKFADLLSKHPMNGVLFKDEFERTFGEGFPWYEMESKKVEEKFDELANEFFLNQKGNEIISDEKAKEIVLNNEYLQKVLDETHDVNFFRDLQRICVKCQNYEYANKFRQKVRDILYTLSTVKLIELVQDGTIELNDMSRAISRQKVESANNNPKQFTLEDMRKAFDCSRVYKAEKAVDFSYGTFEDYAATLKNPS